MPVELGLILEFDQQLYTLEVIDNVLIIACRLYLWKYQAQQKEYKVLFEFGCELLADCIFGNIRHNKESWRYSCLLVVNCLQIVSLEISGTTAAQVAVKGREL